MSKKPPPGNRPGAKKARALLQEVAELHDTDAKSLKEKANHRRFMIARRDYCIRGLHAGISLGALADVLCRDRTTVTYHQRPEMRARKIKQRLAWGRKHSKRQCSRDISHETMQQLGGP